MSQGINYQSFSQAHDRLIAEYRKGQAFHALLLCGPSGTMKAGFASYLAQILLCQSQEAQKPCGECQACRRCLSGRHGNLLSLGVMDGTKTIKIEQLRSLINALSLHPMEAGPRVIVISGMHLMTIQAQNALLKSLEEPLEHDFYLLTCDNERAVLPTIISRCSMVRLPALEDDRIADLLRRSGCGNEQASELSRLSNGRPGFALSVSKDSSYWDTKALADKTFFSVRKLSDIPAASSLLKDAKDSADLLLDMLEQEARQALAQNHLIAAKQLSSAWSQAGTTGLKRVLEALFEARRYKASNVSWQAIADRLLFSITKEIYQCQW